MEVNELMIGDWVLFEPLKESISTERVIGLGEGVVKIRQFWVYMKEIKPIPLTAEILEKNGFTHRNADKILTKQSWTCECGDCTIHAKYNFGFLYFNIYGKPLKPNMFAPHVTMHIQYAHELQHALRLCGIDKEIVL